MPRSVDGVQWTRAVKPPPPPRRRRWSVNGEAVRTGTTTGGGQIRTKDAVEPSTTVHRDHDLAPPLPQVPPVNLSGALCIVEPRFRPTTAELRSATRGPVRGPAVSAADGRDRVDLALGSGPSGVVLGDGRTGLYSRLLFAHT